MTLAIKVNELSNSKSRGLQFTNAFKSVAKPHDGPAFLTYCFFAATCIFIIAFSTLKAYKYACVL